MKENSLGDDKIVGVTHIHHHHYSAPDGLSGRDPEWSMDEAGFRGWRLLSSQ